MDADPACAKKHTGPVANEMLALGSGNTMGNILVWVSKGLPGGKDLARAQDAGGARPEGLPVHAARDGNHGRPALQDPQLRRRPPQHPHAPQGEPGFNKGMPATLKETTTKFDKPEAVFHIKCDVHPWMSAYVAVFTHPFFSVTGTDGKFTISGLDPGTYEITAWHEKLGTQTASVTVGASDTKTQNSSSPCRREVVDLGEPAA